MVTMRLGARPMMVLAVTLCCVPVLCTPADKYVCDDPPDDTRGCDYTNNDLQRAFDEAQPGDVLYLQAGYVYRGAFIFRTSATPDQPITVTSSRAAFLPGSNSRVTPSHLPNLPVLSTNLTNYPALSGAPDANGNPPSNWHFIGMAFRTETAVQFDNSIIHTGGIGVNGWTIAGDAQLPDGLVFDRIYVAGPLDDSLVVQNGVRLNGKNSVFRNSFIFPIFCRAIECHALSTQTHPGPLEVSNNFLSAASIPLFSGGTNPDYPGANQADLVARFNYLYRPLKWWSNPNNPDRKYFLANGSKIPCTKNLGEFKSLDRGLLQFNVHENVWNDDFCSGQYFAFTVTVRQNYWESPAAGGSWGGSLALGTITTSGTTFSWTGTAPILPGHNVCPIFNNVHDCRRVVSADPNTKRGAVSAPFSFNVSALPTWLWVTDDTPLLRDVTVRDSVFRNTAQGLNILARDKGIALPGSDAGRIVRFSVVNNLFQNTIPALVNSPAVRIYSQEQSFTVEPTIGGRDLVIEHNTFDWPNPAYTVLSFVADGISPIARIQNLSIRSNLFPKPLQQPDGNIYALSGSNIGFNRWSIAESFASGTVLLTNNYLPSVIDGACQTAVCRANQTTGDVVFQPGTARLNTSSPLARAAHDGTDIGADYDSLPLIRNLKVTPASTSALLEFELASPIADALNTQPCVLEVSPDENLKSMLGSYTVTNDLNPAFFLQADASTRGGSLNPVLMTGNRLQWPLGGNRTVTDDNGSPQDLSYRPGTSYWGRLMCYGDTAWFQFKTTGASPGAASLAVPVEQIEGAGEIRIEYGATPDLDQLFIAANAPQSGAIEFPVAAGGPLYVRVSYWDAGRLLQSGPIEIRMALQP